MPHVIRPIATIAELAMRARTAARHAVKVLDLPELPFGGINPCNLMAEFNELLAAATRLFGSDQVRDFYPYNLSLAALYSGTPPDYRHQTLRHAANALAQLTVHVQKLAAAQPDLIAAVAEAHC